MRGRFWQWTGCKCQSWRRWSMVDADNFIAQYFWSILSIEMQWIDDAVRPMWEPRLVFGIVRTKETRTTGLFLSITSPVSEYLFQGIPDRRECEAQGVMNAAIRPSWKFVEVTIAQRSSVDRWGDMIRWWINGRRWWEHQENIQYVGTDVIRITEWMNEM